VRAEREREPRGPFTCTCNNSFSITWQREKVGPEWKKKPIVAGDCEQCVICSCLREKIEVGGLSLERKKRDAREMCILDVVSLCGGGFINGSLATFHLRVTRRGAAIYDDACTMYTIIFFIFSLCRMLLLLTCWWFILKGRWTFVLGSTDCASGKKRRCKILNLA